VEAGVWEISPQRLKGSGGGGWLLGALVMERVYMYDQDRAWGSGGVEGRYGFRLPLIRSENELYRDGN